ncbi:MAG TPA: ATP-binding protein [Candidatus Binatia bacterium]|nr:ATP-binding protein [Candidatus Binatia bacterium]
MGVLYRLTGAIAAARDPAEIYDLAIEALCEAVGADRASVLLCDASGAMRFRAWRGLSEGYRAAVEGHSPWNADAPDPAPIVIPDVTVDAELGPLKDIALAEGIRALAFIPLVAQQRLLGKFMLYFDGPRTLSDDDLAAARAIAALIAFAIERAGQDLRLQDTLRREQEARGEAQALLSVIQAVSGTLDVTESMRRMARALARVLGADMVGAYLADPQATVLRPVAGYHVPKAWLPEFQTFAIPIRGHGALEDMWAQPRPIWSDDVAADTQVDRPSVERFPHQSNLVVPIVADAKPIGAFFCVWWAARRRFTESELRLVEEIGRQAGVAVERARLFAEVAAASRAKDEFLAMLAHELRNPLAAILNGVAVLDRVGTGEAAVTARGLIKRQTLHLARLLEDLLDVTRVSHGRIALRREPMDLRAVVGLAVEMQQGQLEAKRQVLTVSLPDGPVVVSGDPDRLQQVVGNLLDNASKYTPEGGAVEVGLAVAGGCAELRVRDTGIGIPAEALPHVFDMFVQVHPDTGRSTGGLGIGLTLVRELVRLHGGTIEASSPGPGAGAEFVVRLPLESATSAGL